MLSVLLRLAICAGNLESRPKSRPYLKAMLGLAKMTISTMHLWCLWKGGINIHIID